MAEYKSRGVYPSEQPHVLARNPQDATRARDRTRQLDVHRAIGEADAIYGASLATTPRAMQQCMPAVRRPG